MGNPDRLGLVPEGWERVRRGVKSKKRPKPKSQEEGRKKWDKSQMDGRGQ